MFVLFCVLFFWEFFYQGEEVYATVRYADIDEIKKITITYKDAEPIVLEDGAEEIVVNYPENTTNIKITIFFIIFLSSQNIFNLISKTNCL